MKRILVAFSVLVMLALGAGSAFAANADWYFQNTNATITDVWYKDDSAYKGSKAGYQNERNVGGKNGYKQYNWGNKGPSYFEVHGVDKKADMDRPSGNTKLPIDDYYGYELNYLHLDIKNYKDDGNYVTPSKFQIYVQSDFTWGGYESSKRPVVATLGTYMDFYYMDALGSNWVFMVSDYVRLGEIEMNGVTYYFDIVNDMSKNKGAVELTGAAYDAAIAEFGFEPGTELWGMELGAGDKAHWKFDIVVTTQDRRPPTVPVPGAVWLMGTGLAGLVALRRRAK